MEESASEWSGPIVLVPKPDDPIWFCIDFHKVNTVSKYYTYPIPRVDEMMEGIGNTKYINTLDLTKGYFEISLDPVS